MYAVFGLGGGPYPVIGCSRRVSGDEGGEGATYRAGSVLSPTINDRDGSAELLVGVF